MSDDSERGKTVQRQGVAVLASPLQRLGAALIDLLLLLGMDIVFFTVLVTALPAESVEGVFLGAATACSVGYLVLFWGRGQTLGKRVFGIKIVGPDGGRPGLLRGALRFAGYVVASAPLKVGLLAMAWDPLRRGWHDRIAGTLVVKETSGDLLPRPPVEEPVSADESVAGGLRWSDLAMLPAFAVATALLTWPAAARIPAQFPSDGGDANLFAWNLWWFRKAALDPALTVWKTDYLFWPETISTRLHSFSIFNCALGVPLQHYLSPTVTYSVLMLAALCLTAFAAYLLGKYVTGRVAGGVLVGLFFGFSPYMVWHAYGHLDLVSSEFAVLYALLLVAVLKKARARCALVAGVSLALAGLCAWYHLTHMAALTSALAVTWFVVHRRGIGRRAALIAVAGITAIVLLSPFLVPMAREFTSGQYGYEATTARARATLCSLDAGSLVTPPPYHPFLGRWTKGIYKHRLGVGSGVEQASFLGWSVLALAAVAVSKRRRRMAHLPWLVVAVCYALLALGFRLRAFDMRGLPLWLVLAAGGPPGNGADLSVVPSVAARFAMALTSASPQTLFSQQQIDLPFTTLWKIGGVMRLASTPCRFAQVAMLGLCVLAAVGALHLAGRAAQKWGKWAGRAVVAGAACVVLLEFLIAPRFPTERAAMHVFYSRLAAERGCTAILEVPCKPLGDSHFMRAQTIHEKRGYFGFVSRLPDDARLFYAVHPLIAKALAASLGDPTETDRSRLGVVAEGEAAFSEARLAVYRADLRALADTGCCYVIVHKGFMDAVSLRAARRLLGEALGLPVYFEDWEVVVYRVPHHAE